MWGFRVIHRYVFAFFLLSGCSSFESGGYRKGLFAPPAVLRTDRAEFSVRRAKLAKIRRVETELVTFDDDEDYRAPIQFSNELSSRHRLLRFRYYLNLRSLTENLENALYLSLFWNIHDFQNVNSYVGVTLGEKNSIVSLAVDRELAGWLGSVVFFSQFDSGRYNYMWHGWPGSRLSNYYGLKLEIREWRSSLRIGARYHLGSAMLSFETGYSFPHTSHLEFQGSSTYFPKEFHSQHSFWTALSLGFKL